MAEMPERRPLQPFTFCGVARFAHGPIIRLYGVAFSFAILSAFVFMVFAARAWVPAIDEAVGNLPANSSIRGGRLIWPHAEASTLGANPFLSISVQPASPAAERTPADLTIRLLDTEFEFQSIFGFARLPYPEGYLIALNQAGAAPVWGAWKPAILGLVGLLVAAGLLLVWALLAGAYLVVPRLVSNAISRPLTWAQAWKLSVMAQMSGAFLMNFGLVLYTFGEISLFLLLAIFAAHFLLSWLYLLVAPFCLPKSPRPPARNPFTPAKNRPRKTNNPFAGDDDPDE